jgi:hypothetical protein
MAMITLAAGRITCLQCRAKSKRTGQQCRAPALKDKAVCKTHGGRSTGPTSAVGRAACASAKTVHGRETRKIRAERSESLARIADLEVIARTLGMIVGPRSAGRRPKSKKA